MQIKGTVIRIDDGGFEPANRNWLILGIKWMAMLCFGISAIVWRVFTGRSIGGSLLSGYLLFGRSQDQVPVHYLRIRDGSMNVHVVRQRGYIDGHITMGDLIVAEGNSRSSCLDLLRGWNLTTSKSFNVRRR